MDERSSTHSNSCVFNDGSKLVELPGLTRRHSTNKRSCLPRKGLALFKERHNQSCAKRAWSAQLTPGAKEEFQMAYISKRNRKKEKERQIAAHNRRELIAAGFKRRDLLKMGLITSAGMPIPQKV